MSNTEQLQPVDNPDDGCGPAVTPASPAVPRSPLLTLVEAAKYLRISRSSLYRQCRLGNVPWRKLPGSKERLFLCDDLDALIAGARIQRNEIDDADGDGETPAHPSTTRIPRTPA